MSRAAPSPMKSPSTRSSTLSRYAAKLGRKRLTHISLANTLAGHTCSPIGLADFEAYLAHKEHSLENLHFAVWYQHYRKRYLALFSTPQAGSQLHCRSDSFHFPISSPARTAQRVLESRRQSEAVSSPGSSPIDSVFSVNLASSSRRGSLAPVLTRSSPAPSQIPTLPYTSTSSTSCDPQRNSALRSLQIECARATATFIAPGAPEELMLDADVRDALLRELTWSIHPDAFLSAYESVVEALETFSLPRFLEHASANINTPKQIFWYTVGVVDMLLAVALAVAFIVCLPSWMSEASRRAWRLVAVPLFSLGSMQAYSAWRGFCSEVWGRGNTQLRAWELEGDDCEANASSAWLALASSSTPVTPVNEKKITLPNVYEDEREDRSSYRHSLRSSTSTATSPETFPPEPADAAISPGLEVDSITPGKCGRNACGPTAAYTKHNKSDQLYDDAYTTSTDGRPLQRDSDEPEADPTPLFDHWGWETSSRGGAGTQESGEANLKPNRGATRTNPSAEHRRPPVFGPERPVLDPHIRAVHAAVMRDMLLAGSVCTLLFTVIVLAVPSAQGP